MWKILAVVLYGGVLLLIGAIASRRTKDIRDYYAGGKKLGFINVAFSARATGESAWLLLGLTGLGFATGAMGFWVVLGEMLGVGGAWLIFARRFKRLSDRYDSITIPDYLESRFRDTGHWLRLIAAGSLLVFVPIYAGSQFPATAKAFHVYVGLDHFVGASIGFFVVLLYVTKGGFIAVVWSDVFQGSLMFLGLVALPIVGLMQFGGESSMLAALREASPDHLSMTAGNGWTPVTISAVIGFAAIGLGFYGSPQVFVRFISLRSEKEIKKGAAVALTWTLLADSGAVLVGMVGRALYDLDTIGGDKEFILPHMSQTLLPSFVAGIFIAMVLSAIMSTIDSLLVIASSSAVRDYWQKTKNLDVPESMLMFIGHLLTFTLALVAYIIGLWILLYDKDEGVFWMIIFGWSGIAATFCPVMILSLFWSKLTALAARWAMVAGFLSVPIFKFVVPWMLVPGGITESRQAELNELGNYTTPELLYTHLANLDVIAPSFVVSFAVAFLVSSLDKRGRERIADVKDDLRYAAGRD